MKQSLKQTCFLHKNYYLIHPNHDAIHKSHQLDCSNI